MTSTSDVVVVRHLALAEVTDQDISNAVAEGVFGPSTTTVKIGRRLLQLDELAELDWAREHHLILADLESKLAAALKKGGPIYYFGMPPIPLGVELGARIGPTRDLRTHQQHHVSKRWGWSTAERTVAVDLRGLPSTPCLAKGDVIVRVSCSHAVALKDARGVIPHPLGELHLEVKGPHEDVLQSYADVAALAEKFGEAMDGVRQLYPNCDTVHLFAAVPPALAVKMGAELNPTIHTPVQTYQFSSQASPRYTKALLVGERPRLPLTDQETAAATRGRAALRDALAELKALVHQAEEPESGRWIEELLGVEGSSLPAALRQLGSVGRLATISRATVNMNRHDADGEFLFDKEARSWVFDDRLCAALAARLSGDELQRAGRVFLLHEAVHDRQGITTATAERVGRLPRVLEDVDYLADVWALLNEYARAVRIGETTRSEAAAFFSSTLRVVTATFWAFDAPNIPLRAVQVRRLNRYLIWYWQRLELEGAESLDDVLRTLATKPVLEISGPRVMARNDRVLFDLDPTYHDAAVEIGFLQEGYRLARVGTRPGARVSNLLEAVRTGDDRLFMEALRGIYESIQSTR